MTDATLAAQESNALIIVPTATNSRTVNWLWFVEDAGSKDISDLRICGQESVCGLSCEPASDCKRNISANKIQ